MTVIGPVGVGVLVEDDEVVLLDKELLDEEPLDEEPLDDELLDKRVMVDEEPKVVADELEVEDEEDEAVAFSI